MMTVLMPRPLTDKYLELENQAIGERHAFTSPIQSFLRRMVTPNLHALANHAHTSILPAAQQGRIRAGFRPNFHIDTIHQSGFVMRDTGH